MLEIVKYTPVNQGKKIAYFDIGIPKLGLIFRHMVLLQSGPKRWVNFPTFADEEGERKHFHSYMEFQQGTHNAEFLEQVNEAVKDYCIKHHVTFPEPLNLEGECEGVPF